MIRHASVLTFVDGTTDEQMRAIADALATLPPRFTGMRAYHVGPNVGADGGNGSFVVVGDFDTMDDYIVYRDDPEHRRIGAELIIPILASRAAAQYEVV